MNAIGNKLISFFKHRARYMTGGLYFGQPEWRVNSWIFDSSDVSSDPARQAALPGNREELLKFLHLGGLMPRTCGGTPSLFEQLAALESRKAEVLIINLIPQMPESILPSAMTQYEFSTMAAGIDLIRKCLGAP